MRLTKTEAEASWCTASSVATAAQRICTLASALGVPANSTPVGSMCMARVTAHLTVLAFVALVVVITVALTLVQGHSKG